MPDQIVGFEEVYLFASREPIPELEGLESGRKADLAQDGLKLMGPAGVRPVQAKLTDEGREYAVALNELVAAGRFVYQIGFEHQ
ncbi:MAG: hypothetical protein AB1641_21515 [Thermodesulfobacteriota bacterium]